MNKGQQVARVVSDEVTIITLEANPDYADTKVIEILNDKVDDKTVQLGLINDPNQGDFNTRWLLLWRD
jgi:hypothetical protein